MKHAKATTLIPFKKIKINHEQKWLYFGHGIHIGSFPLRLESMKCCYLDYSRNDERKIVFHISDSLCLTKCDMDTSPFLVQESTQSIPV